ncbi:hypothetical protein [Endozoicomonas sp. 4G]|uniref:hypothetical protein n=1 Tax=Endozoicomonas sp. 4G TaxID=2872754 RepID=UPI002078F647|nr:hypothetical protein [Endozoicomonas sp. 4G]
MLLHDLTRFSEPLANVLPLLVPLKQHQNDELFYPSEPTANDRIKESLQLEVVTPSASTIQISKASNGVFVTDFKTSESDSRATSTSGQVYLNQLDTLTLNKIRLVFDTQDNTLRFSFHGNTFIIREFSDSELSEPYQSFLVPAVLLMPEVLQLVVNLIQHLNEHPEGIEGEEAFAGGMLEQTDVNEYLIFSDFPLFPTYPNTSFCRGSSHCIPLGQYAWLVYSGHGKAAIISDPYSSDEPSDGKKGKGSNSNKRKTTYTPAPADFTNFRIGNTRGSYQRLGSGSSSDGEDNEPPRKPTDYSKTLPADKNDFEEFEEYDETNFLIPTDDEAEQQDAQVRSDEEMSVNDRLTRRAVQGKRKGKLRLDILGVKSGSAKGASSRTPSPPETPCNSDQGSPETETTIDTPDTSAPLSDNAEKPVDHSSKREQQKGMSSKERKQFVDIGSI